TEHAPLGVRFEGVAKLSPDDATISKILGDGAHARYVVGVPRSALPHLALYGFDACKTRTRDDDVSLIRSQIEGQLQGAGLTVMRVIEGIGKKIDVRSYLERAVVDSVSARRAHDEAGIAGDLVAIEVDTRFSGSGGVKISEVVEALLGKET